MSAQRDDWPSLDAVRELYCSLSTIYGIATSNGHNAMREIMLTAHAGMKRCELILPQEKFIESGKPCDYFAERDCKEAA